MDLYTFLHERTTDILNEAQGALERARLRHYDEAGGEHVHQRLRALLVLTTRAVKDRNLGPMVLHAEDVARERFASGYDLWEVQTAFNVLEEAIWKRVISELPSSEYASALGLVSTVLGAGKDTLARRYVSLGTRSRAPSLDMRSLFTGTEGS